MTDLVEDSVFSQVRQRFTAKNLFSAMTRPYVILTPPWTHVSSGVRALYLLCHALNEVGQKAFVATLGPTYLTNPFLNAPNFLGVCNDIQTINDSNFDYIAVYPDITRGNPLGAKNVVRWMLAPPGAHGGDTEFPATDQLWGYTTPIAKQLGTDRVMLLPTFDRSIFYAPKEPAERKGFCFHARKYNRIHGNPLLPITVGMQEVAGTPREVADLLRRSEACYVYEMSEIIMTAQLCGCPVVLIKTPYFNETNLPPEIEFRYYGARWSDSEQPINTPLRDPWWADTNYLVDELMLRFPYQLERFIAETQGM